MLQGLYNDHIVKFMKTGYFYEQILLDKILAMNIVGSYIDIGANIGNHSLFFGEYCPAKKVVAIEISPELCNVLKSNLQGSQYEIINIGVSDKIEYVGISDIDRNNTGMTKIVGEGDILVDKLDNVLSCLDLGKIGIIKIDVEGYEYKALQGAIGTIQANSPVIACESHTRDEFNKINNLLSDLGYKVHRKNGMPYDYGISPTFIWERS